jgi:type IV pilus assembly protein PilB
MANRFGDILVKTGKVTQQQLQEALSQQREKGGRLGSILVNLDYLTEEDLVESLSQHFGVPAIDLDGMEIDDAVIKIIPADIARKYTILPVSKAGATVTLAMIDPTNVFAMDDVKFMTGYRVEPVVASETAIRLSIDRYYGSTHSIELKKVMEDLSEDVDTDLEVLEEEEELDLGALEDESDQAPVVKLVYLFLTDGIMRDASDIHI